jgi:hypothetical protein
VSLLLANQGTQYTNYTRWEKLYTLEDASRINWNVYYIASTGARNCTLVVTDNQDTTSMIAGVIIGSTLVVVETQDTTSLQDKVLVQGTLTATDGQDSATLQAKVIIASSLTVTDGQDTAILYVTTSGSVLLLRMLTGLGQ